MIRYLERGESNLTTVVYNTILNSSASLCVSASPQWAPHTWPLLPSFCSSSHDSLTACKEIHLLTEIFPLLNPVKSHHYLRSDSKCPRKGGKAGSGWEWAKGPQFWHRVLPSLSPQGGYDSTSLYNGRCCMCSNLSHRFCNASHPCCLRWVNIVMPPSLDGRTWQH